MTIYNNQWVQVRECEKTSVSYIPLQSIDRVTIRDTRGVEPFDVILHNHGAMFLYKKSETRADADNAALEILQLIETAFGRIVQS